MRNQYMAKVLVHNKVVTEDQVNAHWDEITDQMDIGQVLVQAGILPQPMYEKVLAFVKNLEAKNAAAQPASWESLWAAFLLLSQGCRPRSSWVSPAAR